MKRIFLAALYILLVSGMASAWTFCPEAEQTTLTVKLVDEAGNILDINDVFLGVSDANGIVWGYAPFSHGVAVIPALTSGTYFLNVSWWAEGQNEFQEYKVWYNKKPVLSEANPVTIKGRSKTVKMVFKRASDILVDIPTAPLVRGSEAVITGSGFGDTKGWIDFNGFITSSKSYVLSWTDTAITVKVPSNATSGDLRVCTPEAGCSAPVCVTVVNAP